MSGVSYKYTEFLRYTYCLDFNNAYKQGKGCGERNLYSHVGPAESHLVQATNIEETVCVWRLFDRRPDSESRYLKYEFSYNPLANTNTEVVVFDDSSSEVLRFD